MTGTAIGFFIFGAIVLWGGFASTLGIAIKNEKNNKLLKKVDFYLNPPSFFEIRYCDYF